MNALIATGHTGAVLRVRQAAQQPGVLAGCAPRGQAPGGEPTSSDCSELWCPLLGFHCLPLPLFDLSLPFTAVHCLLWTLHCLSLPFVDLSLPSFDLSLPSNAFHCLLWTLHCLSLPFVDLSLPISAFRWPFTARCWPTNHTHQQFSC